MAKSLADKIDTGMILLDVTQDDLAKLEPILASNPGFETPNIKLSIYKNRRGAYKGCFLWGKADLGTCRVNPQFLTTWNYVMMSIEDIRIIVEDDDPPPWDTKD